MGKIPKLLKIIVVEPLGEINLGSIARLCQNFEVDELRIVSPRCNPIHPDGLRMATHGKNFLLNATIYSNLIDAIEDCVKVIATCGRIDHGNIPIHSCKNALQWISKTTSQKPIGIIFGREDRGLSNSELLMAQKVISLNTSDNYPSLNLSHAVAIILHQLHSLDESDSIKSNTSNYPATPKELNDFIEDAKTLLLEIGFLQPHTAEARISKIKGLLQRAQTRSEEVSLIRGILRQVRWFSSQNKNR